MSGLKSPTDAKCLAYRMLHAVYDDFHLTCPAMGVLQFPSSAAKNARSQSTAVYAGQLGARRGQEGAREGKGRGVYS